MNFQLQAFDPKALAASFADMADSSLFANVQMREFNRIRHEDGQLFVVVGGQEVRRGPALHVVIAAFQHDDFNKARRQWYDGQWSPSQEAGKKPDCQSFDGIAPDAGVAKPQAAACAQCPHSKKGDDGYTGCSYRKNFIMYLVNVDANGGAVVDTSTPYVFDASSKSMYTEYHEATRSGGTHRIIPMLRKSGVPLIEALVFELGFFQGSKAPVLKPVAAVPPAVAQDILNNARAEATQQLLLPVAARTTAPALPAPTQQAAQGLQYTPPAQVVQKVPEQVVNVQQAAPVQQAQTWGDPAPVQAQASPAQWDAAPQVTQAAPAEQAAPVAQAAPEGNKLKALGAFSSLIGTR